MVRFLHISLRPIDRLKDDSGVLRGGQPRGIWYARDFAWISYMNEQHQWVPSAVSYPGSFPGDILAIYRHVVGEARVPPVGEGERVDSLLDEPTHYVYDLKLPDRVFASPTEAPGLDKVLRVTRATVDTFVDAAVATLDSWSNPLIDGLLEDVLREKGPRAAALREIVASKWMTVRDELKLSDPKRAKMATMPKDYPNYLILKHSKRDLLEAIFRTRSISVPPLYRLFWVNYVQTLQPSWGGIEFAEDLWSLEGHMLESYLNTLSRPSGVLFHPSAVLGTDEGSQFLTAIVAMHPVSSTPPGVPVYQFGLTETNELRLVSQSGGRRKTRRRMLKNPKTLKKRIR